jgi:hypothetical protein
MCCFADAFTDTSGASKDSPTAPSALAPAVVRIYNASDLSLIHSSPYLIAVSIVFVLLGGVFTDAGEDNHALKCLYIGATFPVWLSAWSHVLSPAASK